MAMFRMNRNEPWASAFSCAPTEEAFQMTVQFFGAGCSDLAKRGLSLLLLLPACGCFIQSAGMSVDYLQTMDMRPESEDGPGDAWAPRIGIHAASRNWNEGAAVFELQFAEYRDEDDLASRYWRFGVSLAKIPAGNDEGTWYKGWSFSGGRMSLLGLYVTYIEKDGGDAIVALGPNVSWGLVFGDTKSGRVLCGIGGEFEVGVKVAPELDFWGSIAGKVFVLIRSP
jgi:hypothetical protein